MDSSYALALLLGIVVGLALGYVLFKRRSSKELEAMPGEERKSENDMLQFRTIAQILKDVVVPEVEQRLKSGTIRDSPPIQIKQFRFIQKRLLGDQLENIVEINDEVPILLTVKAKRRISAGETVTLDDIDPKECHINPPVYAAKPAAYFLCQSSFLSFHTFFDFSPNAPKLGKDFHAPTLPYPLQELVRAKQLRDRINPVEKHGLKPPEFREEGIAVVVTFWAEISVSAQVSAQVTAQVASFCREPKSAKQIMAELGLKHWKTFQSNYLRPLLEAGILERTIPDKPQSRLQRYRTTAAGLAVLKKKGK